MSWEPNDEYYYQQSCFLIECQIISISVETLLLLEPLVRREFLILLGKEALGIKLSNDEEKRKAQLTCQYNASLLVSKRLVSISIGASTLSPDNYAALATIILKKELGMPISKEEEWSMNWLCQKSTRLYKERSQRFINDSHTFFLNESNLSIEKSEDLNIIEEKNEELTRSRSFSL